MKRFIGYALFLVWVAIGGAIGAAARWGLFALLPDGVSWLPTLVVNALGALIIGFVSAWEERVHHHVITFAAIGFCGGFTTLSHYALQMVALLERGDLFGATLNSILSLGITLVAVIMGAWIAHRLARTPKGAA